ncbi:MAG: DUF3667 domain-containing protein [Arenimonas sp.]
MTQTRSDATTTCRNCGADMPGAYCPACGQKRVTAGERGLAHLLREAFHLVTDVDGKLLRSLRLLLFSPGMLSREYLDDRRARYSTPLGLFVIANVLYFFAPALTDFNLPFTDQVPGAIAAQLLDPADPASPARARYLAGSLGQMHSKWTVPLVWKTLAARAATRPGYDLRALAADYDREAGIVGKVLMIVHVPILALALALVYVRKRRYFAEHFVVALHLFTFLLLFVQAAVTPLAWLAGHTGVDLPPPFGALLAYALFGLLSAYLLAACRTAYRIGWGAATPGLVALLFGLWFANLWVYRTLQFVVTLQLM